MALRPRLIERVALGHPIPAPRPPREEPPAQVPQEKPAPVNGSPVPDEKTAPREQANG